MDSRQHAVRPSSRRDNYSLTAIIKNPDTTTVFGVFIFQCKSFWCKFGANLFFRDRFGRKDNDLRSERIVNIYFDLLQFSIIYDRMI